MTPRVLVIEDDSSIRDGVVMVLEIEGFEVREATDGREALEVLDGWQPDIILLDLMMPVMTGWDFRQAQLNNGTIAAIPVIVMTGCTSLEREVAALQPAGFLQKPASAQAMLDKIRSVFPG